MLGHSCTAYLLVECKLPRPPGFKGAGSLGRPWRWMATVVFMHTWLDDHIPAAGWTLGKPPYPSGNLTFAEYNSSGPGARSTRPAPARVLQAGEAAGWTAARVLKGWDPAVPSQQPYCWDNPAACAEPRGFADKLPLKTDESQASKIHGSLFLMIIHTNVLLCACDAPDGHGAVLGDTRQQPA